MPTEPGPLLAAGRDSEVFDLGDGRVLRRPKRGRSLAAEAAVIAHVAAAGYPVPRVDEVLANGSLVMERIDGPSMLDDLAARPWQVRRHARTLALLLARLHGVAAPGWLPHGPLPGPAVVHLDLHPANVLLASRGPVVIDWANAAAGASASDDAVTWLLCSVGKPPTTRPLERAVVAAFQRRFADAVLDHLDRRAAMAAIPRMAAWKAADANTTPSERDALRRYVGRA